MPQMAPMSWSLLFVAFLTLYTLNTVKVYFSSNKSMSSDPGMVKTNAKSLSWKW